MGEAASAAFRKMAEAAGVDLDAIEPAELTDEEALAQQQWADDRKHHRLHGEACAVCSKDVKVNDEGALHEVTGWTLSPRGVTPALVFGAERTNRIVCGTCGEALTGPRQESML